MNRWKRTIMLLWGDFRLWLGAPRTLWMILSMAVFALLHVRSGWMYGLEEGMYSPAEIIVYFFYDGFHLMMSSTIFLLGCSEIPRRIAWQQQGLIRSDRRSWLIAYIGQCLLMALVTMGLLIAVTLLLSWGRMRPGQAWADLERIARMEILPSDSVFPPFLMQKTTPLQGAVMCVMPVLLFWFSMLLVILLFGMTGMPHAGLLICAFAVLSYVCLMADDNWMDYLALFRYTRLSGMNLEVCGLGRFRRVIAGYAILDGGLMAVMLAMVRRMDFALMAGARR